MTVRLQVNLGWGVVAVDGPTNTDVIEDLAFWQSLPKECPECQSPLRFVVIRNLETRDGHRFDARKLQCSGEPPHSYTFGTHTENGSLFYREGERWYELGSGRADSEPHEEPPRQPQRQQQSAPRGTFDQRVRGTR